MYGAPDAELEPPVFVWSDPAAEFFVRKRV
jgi:hypothetical protein